MVTASFVWLLILSVLSMVCGVSFSSLSAAAVTGASALDLKTILWADCLRRQLVILLVGPQGDSATVPAGIASWKSDRPALQRHNRLLLSLLSFMTFRERPRGGGSRGGGSRPLQGSCCEIL